MTTRRRMGEGASGPVLPITPMLDMAFQLFAFFVVTYHPSQLEGQMQLNLPGAKGCNPVDGQVVDPVARPEDALDLPAEITVVAGTQPAGPSQGQISRL